MARTVTLILGGASSGKSTFAEGLALDLSNTSGVTYIATADSLDREMAYRIERHKSRRPKHWQTWEKDICTLPEALGSMNGVLLLDCLTMYLTRLFLASPSAESDDESAWVSTEQMLLDSVARIFETLPAETSPGPFVQITDFDPPTHLIVVSNEVGFGVVPPSLMGRRFRDIQGRANQIAASYADNVALIVAGLPLWIKGGL